MIKVKRVWLENYKGIKSFDSEMSDTTLVSGKNASGKTTIQDAIFDILTGKMSNGTNPDNIRPVDKDGNEIPRLVIKRGIVIDADGEEYSIEKITTQKWSKKRGTTEEVFGGNVTTYRINEFDKKVKDYNEFIENLVGKQELILLCMNASTFIGQIGKSTVESRKTLEKASGFSLDKFIESNEKYKDIKSALFGSTVEEATKQLKKNLAQQKKSLDAANTRLAYEEGRDIPSVDKELEKKTVELLHELEDIINLENEIESKQREVSELNKKLNDALGKQRDYVSKADKKLSEERSAIVQELCKANASKRSSVDNLRMYQNDVEAINSEIKSLVSHKNYQVDKWTKKKDEVFSEDDAKCPTCGRKLPEKSIATAKAKFEKDRKKELESLETAAKITVESIKSNKSRLSIYEEKASWTKNLIADLDKSIADLEMKLESIPMVADLSEDEEFIRISNEVASIKKELEEFDDKRAVRAELRSKRNALDIEYTNAMAKLKSQRDFVSEHENALERLHEDVDVNAQKCADLEMKIDAIAEFSVAKNTALTDAVNSYFDYIKIDMFDYTQDGGVVETLKIMVDGVNYFSGLNHGSRILAECDLIRGLQKMNGLNLPVIIDDSESLDPDRVPKIDNQLILLRRTDDDKLTVGGVDL